MISVSAQSNHFLPCKLEDFQTNLCLTCTPFSCIVPSLVRVELSGFEPKSTLITFGHAFANPCDYTKVKLTAV